MNVFKEFDEIGVQYTYPEEEWKIYKKNEIHLANIDHAIRIKVRIADGIYAVVLIDEQIIQAYYGDYHSSSTIHDKPIVKWADSSFKMYKKDNWKPYGIDESVDPYNEEQMFQLTLIEDVDWISVAELMRGIDMIREKVGLNTKQFTLPRAIF